MSLGGGHRPWCAGGDGSGSRSSGLSLRTLLTRVLMRVGLEVACGGRYEQALQVSVGSVSGLSQRVPVGGVEDDRHAVVDRFHQLVGGGGDDDAGPQRLGVGVARLSCQTSQSPAKAIGWPSVRRMTYGSLLAGFPALAGRRCHS